MNLVFIYFLFIVIYFLIKNYNKFIILIIYYINFKIKCKLIKFHFIKDNYKIKKYYYLNIHIINTG